MRIMVVDDESILRKGIIHKILLSQLPLEIIGEAADGISGLEMVQRDAPDIIITDIRMPGMDGLEFIEQALKVNPQMAFIIISGFRDFEYAKKAIHFGVSDYLLKPIEDEELLNSLTKIMRNIELEQKNNDEVKRLRHSHVVNQETTRQQYLTKMIQQSGHTNQPSLEIGSGISDVQERYAYYLAIILVLEPFQLPHYSFRINDENLIWFAVGNIMSEGMALTGQKGVVFQHAIHEREMVYLLGLESSDESSHNQFWLADVLFGIQNYLKLHVTIAIGNMVDDINKMHQSYKLAKIAIRNKMIGGTGKIYDYESIYKQTTDRQTNLIDENEHMLFQLLSDCNAKVLQNWIEMRIQTIVLSPSANYSHLEWFCVELYLLFRKYLHGKTNDTEWLIGEMDDLLLSMQSLHTWHEVVEQMQQYVSNTIGYLEKIKYNPNLDFMEDVKRYLQDHFHEPISLQSIAELFNIHPNYFSRRFKEKFCEGFIDYLTNLRMHKAAEWMMETDLKMIKIASMVGFDDANYFSTVFKKTYGISPKQFREKLQTEK